MNALERPTWVLATDGLFYQNPAVAGEGWVLEFELKLARLELDWREGDEWTRVHERADRVLTDAGFRGRISGPIIGEKERTGPRLVWIVYYLLTEPVPHNLMRQGAGRRRPPGPDRAYILDFGRPWE